MPKWLQAGMLAEGQGHAQEAGPPQGGRGSPWAAPSSLHDVLALGADRWRRQDARGAVRSGRYADACIVGFAHRDEAERCWRARRARMGQVKRALHPEQTRLIELGRFAVERRQRCAQAQPGPVDVLGFPPRCSKTRNGECTVRRKTLAQRRRRPLQAVQDTRRRRLPWPIPQPGAWRTSGLWGPDRSSGVPRHGSRRTVCRDTIRRDGWPTRRRRRPRHRMTWPRLSARAAHGLPKPHSLHPYPAQRLGLCVTPRGRGPGRSCRTPGSVRGASGNWRPYRNRFDSKNGSYALWFVIPESLLRATRGRLMDHTGYTATHGGHEPHHKSTMRCHVPICCGKEPL
jgi:RNA-directed DNA polymerase